MIDVPHNVKFSNYVSNGQLLACFKYADIKSIWLVLYFQLYLLYSTVLEYKVKTSHFYGYRSI